VHIAQVAPLIESVPPQGYGGTERVVSYLTEELIDQGHEVTLFASGDSRTRARLVAPCPHALRLAPDSGGDLPYSVLALEKVLSEAHRFDVIHFHLDCLHFPIARRMRRAQLTTMHGRLDRPELAAVFDEFAEMPVVSISNRQRLPLAGARWLGTVYHGLPERLYALHPEPGRYLAFIGRICPEKRVDRAIRIAEALGIPLKIAAKVDKADRAYFDAVVAPMIRRSPLVELVGEIGDREKDDFLGGALALLFPIDWPEPFGLAMIEAMACGTPVLAFRRGAVPEVVEDGVTGFLVESVAGAVAAGERLARFDRARCRREFERRFSAARMARDYVRLYRRAQAELSAPAEWREAR